MQAFFILIVQGSLVHEYYSYCFAWYPRKSSYIMHKIRSFSYKWGQMSFGGFFLHYFSVKGT